ncbi:sensor histidine kinase [Gemelliphila asaccharolytica]|uniref:histidine kinase n=1 Tax=Gemelliphila asaccharolytica TaxID=502393 RepID=A0ABR5TLJ6_9BACL|nr:HAMP domain-containing sensor histidine kinase [Gemella asaccharolytica]KXB57837.1 HAMP domain protein [Gemella asaccharolytica]
MRNLKIFPKMFLQIFSILIIIIIIVHSLVFFIFPKTYLETRKQEINIKANEISNNINGKDINFVNNLVDFYSKNNEIKLIIKSKGESREVKIDKNVNFDSESKNNSLIIEEREVTLNDGKELIIQFISTADMQKDAKQLSLKFLPYSLSVSLILSLIISLIYAKAITKNIKEIKNVTYKMMQLDRSAILKVNSTNEVGELKNQINNLYSNLLELIDNLEVKNKEILKLEKIKYDFFRGASHELKTPIASLRIILENMKYNIGDYKNKEKYIDNCIDIVDELTKNISQILMLSATENFRNDEEIIIINDVIKEVIKKYEFLAIRKNIFINNYLTTEKIYIGKNALKIVLSNIISNAVKYTNENGKINIGIYKNSLYIENTFNNEEQLDIDSILNSNFDLNKKNSNGLGLYIVKNILRNYKIKNQFKKRDNFIVFLIDISKKNHNKIVNFK